MKVSIVLPVYNEGSGVLIVLSKLTKLGHEAVVVDDGSNDATKLKLHSIKKPNITVLHHKVNLGKGSALKTGCEYAFSHGADAVILMDSDGQHAVNDLHKFIEKLKTGKYDVIFGSRNLNLGMPFIRFIGNKVASVIINLMFGIYVSDLISGFRAITKKAYGKIKWDSTGYGVETEMVIRIKKRNLKYCEIPIETIYFDNYKGVSILDAFGILLNLVYWKISIK